MEPVAHEAAPSRRENVRAPFVAVLLGHLRHVPIVTKKRERSRLTIAGMYAKNKNMNDRSRIFAIKPLRGDPAMSETSDFGTFGRFIETPVDDMSPEMRHAYDYTYELRGLVPGPHKIWLANPALSETIVPTGAYYQRHSTLTKA